MAPVSADLCGAGGGRGGSARGLRDVTPFNPVQKPTRGNSRTVRVELSTARVPWPDEVQRWGLVSLGVAGEDRVVVRFRQFLVPTECVRWYNHTPSYSIAPPAHPCPIGDCSGGWAGCVGGCGWRQTSQDERARRHPTQKLKCEYHCPVSSHSQSSAGSTGPARLL